MLSSGPIRVLAVMFVVAVCSSASAETLAVANAGTLTCTTSDMQPQASADVELSCRFLAQTGSAGSFKGFVARKGQADFPPGKRVLVWSVLSANTDIDFKALEGQYAGLTGGQPVSRLIGGQNNSVVLEPITVTSQIGDKAVPTVLVLRLVPVKA
jgi:hypothetical protein